MHWYTADAGRQAINGVQHMELPAVVWTAGHDKELVFHQKKRRHRECESFNVGHLAPEETHCFGMLLAV